MSENFKGLISQKVRWNMDCKQCIFRLPKISLLKKISLNPSQEKKSSNQKIIPSSIILDSVFSAFVVVNLEPYLLFMR